VSRPGVALADFDHARYRRGLSCVAGVDEAGRGCLAGPVVSGAAVLRPGWCPEGLDDSKKLSAAVRESLYDAILEGALAWGAFAVWPREIDRTNILRASLKAMAGAVGLLGLHPDLVLVDGNQTPPLDCDCECVVKGDGRSAAIAAGAIIAKVTRDRIMTGLDVRFPEYGFAAHKGYGSPEHLASLAEHGPCTLHRFSYKPVADLRQTRLW
jgi:ribonuclease HII